MMKRVVLGAFVGTLLVVSTGCNPECTDQFDCTSNKGAPPSGQEWTCTANKCVATNIAPPPSTDAGTGTDTDAGTDAGTGTGTTDAGTDAGTVPDMSIAEGGACTTTASCMAGLYCDGTQKCAPLQLVYTVTDSATSGSQSAVISPYKPATGSTAPTALSEASGIKSRFPRWSKDGKTVAFVADDNTNVTLVTRAVPLAAGNSSTLYTAAAGTTDLRYSEWEPGPSILWSPKTASSTSGILSIAPGGTLTTYETAGVFPSWSGDGTHFAYSVNTHGLNVRSVNTGSENTVTGVSSLSAEQPLYNKVNDVVLYLDAKNNSESFGGSTTPLTELYTPLVAPATDATVIAAATKGSGDPAIDSYIFNHTWSPLGTHVAYVRVYYSKASSGTATLCNDGSPCGGQVGNVVFVRRVNTDGTPSGDEMLLANEATLPSFSPDGQFIAYLSGGKLFVQQIDPAATTAATLKKGSAIQHTWSSTTTRVESSFGDDDRPRWQPR